MQENSQKKPYLTNLLATLIQKLKSQKLKNHSRPEELPPTAPDCGWNHGEDKEK
jgi:hypothetical protein